MISRINGEKATSFRVVKARAKHGYHFVKIDVVDRQVISIDYKEFPQGDFSIPVQIYPIYEETTEGTILKRVPSLLKHIQSSIPVVNGDIFKSLKENHYYDFKQSLTLGETESGRANGYWIMSFIKKQAAKIRNNLPLTDNSWKTGILLQGLYATINIHPEAITKFGPLTFQPQLNAGFFPIWQGAVVDGKTAQEMIPSQAFSGKPLFSDSEAWNRPARRLKNHDPREYINDGFDELQVYYAINTLFEELHSRGFIDPDLATRPFNAFLFDPDIAYRDNAYYTDDTINFTTYSPNARNYARDNSTIWHELGHGVMDRLMGDHIELDDTGGLSEGMADFIAALVIQAVTKGEPFPGSTQFRINNKIGFHLTNEIHDDGEAYGGSMKDFLDAVISKYGQQGLDKVTDVVLETMRLTRDYPGLTAKDWFQHLLFADSLGRPNLREPGELKIYLLSALAGRNFKMNGKDEASFSLVNTADGKEIVSGNPGSRDHEITISLSKNQKADFMLHASLKNSNEYSFKFPVKVKVEYNKGALQGAIHWIGKEHNPQEYTLSADSPGIDLPLEVSGTCDQINRTDESCVDYAYVQIWNNGEAENPVAKKRFYLRVKNPEIESQKGLLTKTSI